jgi:HEAT repeat protein
VIRGADQERVLAQLCAMGLPQILQKRLQRGSRDGRLVCLEALAALNDEEARAALWAATRQADPQVRHLAFQALAAGDTPIPLELVLAETNRQHARPSRLLTEVVRHAVTADSARALCMLEDRNLTASDVALVVDSLGWTGDYGLIPTITAYAAHQDPEIRTAAIRGLGRLQHPLAEPALAAALDDPAWPVRAAAAEASGLANLGSLCEPLGRLLSDNEWWVRFRAGDALARLGSKGVTRLKEIASTGDPLAQRAAELALAEHNL